MQFDAYWRPIGQLDIDPENGQMHLREPLSTSIWAMSVAQSADHALGNLHAIDIERGYLIAKRIGIPPGDTPDRDVAALNATAL